MSGYTSSDEEPHFANAPGGIMVANDNMPAGSITPGKINSLKTQIKNLLLQIELGIEITETNIDSVIVQQMQKRNITPIFVPKEPSLQTQYDQLTTLLKQLNQEKLEQLQKKGGKRRKSKRYRKSKKQRKTKTKRRLRRSYKYKYK
jgi:hypothetical protein